MRWPWRNEETSSLDARRKCIKLQKPPRLHSPFSFCRQQASRKSVTGESSAYNGRPAGGGKSRITRPWHENTHQHTSDRSNYRLQSALRFPIRSAHTRCQSNGRLRCHTPVEPRVSGRFGERVIEYAHAVREGVQTSRAHSTSLRIWRRNLLEGLSQ